jgi:hypothetical protein
VTFAFLEALKKHRPILPKPLIPTLTKGVGHLHRSH